MYTTTQQRIQFFFLNVGHFYDHLFILIFATVAALQLANEWHMDYGELVLYATPSFVAFGVCAIAAGWIADKWSRQGMMVVFFIGIGVSSILTAQAQTPLQLGAGLLLIGVFAAIYHPVGLSMVIQGRIKTGVPLAINGVFGNLGVASAALIAGYLIDIANWRFAFLLPGVISAVTGIAYLAFVQYQRKNSIIRDTQSADTAPPIDRPIRTSQKTLLRIIIIIFVSTAIGGLIFQSTTFALPKIFAERLTDIAGSASTIGTYAFLVFAIAACAQLITGYLVDHHSARTIFAYIAMVQVVFLALMYNAQGLMALFIAIAFMFAVFGQIPINDVLIGRIARNEWRSRAYAIRYVVTFSVMASAVPFIAWLHTNWGFGVLFIILSCAAAIILTSVLFLPHSKIIHGNLVTNTS